jgi:hypothetical protein
MYVPESEEWYSFSQFEMLDYEYFEVNDPDLILLIKQRIYDYTSQNAIENPVDPEQFSESLTFYEDVKTGVLNGYTFLYQDDFGIAFLRSDLHAKHFNKVGE